MLRKAASVIGNPRLWFQDALLIHLFRNAALIFSGNMGASLIGLVSLALTARALGVEQFGILVLITTYVLIIDNLVNFQSWQAIIKYGAEALENQREHDFKSLLKFGFLLDICTAAVGTIIAAGAVWSIGKWQGWEEHHAFMAAIYSFTILFNVTGTPTAVLRLYDKFKKIAVQQIIAAAIKLAGVTFAFVSDAGLWSFLAIWAMADIAGKGILIYFAARELDKQKVHGIAKSSVAGMSIKFKGIWGFVWTTNINSSIRMTTRELDIMIVAGVLGPVSVGLYKIAKQFAFVIQQAIDPLYQAIFPELAKLYSQKNIKSFVKIGIRSSIMAGLISISAWLGFYFFGTPIYTYTVGTDYLGAIPVMLWYMMAVVVASFAFPLQPAMLSMGRPHTTFWVHIGSTIVYFGALYLLLPSVGLAGAGMAYLIYYIIWSLAMFLIEVFLLSHKRLS